MSTYQLGFIGTGNMGGALAQAAAKSGAGRRFAGGLLLLVLAALALFAVYLAAQQALGLWGILLVFIPFILFLALSILLIRLKKPGKPAPRAGAKNGRPPQGSRRRPGAAASENREPHTSQFSRLNLEKTTDLRYVQKTLVDQNMAHTIIRK